MYHRIDDHRTVFGLYHYRSAAAGRHYAVFCRNACDHAAGNCSDSEVVSITVSQIATVIDFCRKDFNIIGITVQINSCAYKLQLTGQYAVTRCL